MTGETMTELACGAGLGVLCVAALGWLLTHDGCAHPIGHLLAMIVLVGAGTILLLPAALRLMAGVMADSDEGEGESDPVA